MFAAILRASSRLSSFTNYSHHRETLSHKSSFPFSASKSMHAFFLLTTLASHFMSDCSKSCGAVRSLNEASLSHPHSMKLPFLYMLSHTSRVLPEEGMSGPCSSRGVSQLGDGKYSM